MKKLIRPAGWATVAAAALLVGVSPAQEKKPADPPKKAEKKPTVMQRKLAHSQKVLEGLALEDFDKLRTNAEGLIECVKEASWRINNTDKYVLFSNDFLRSAQNLQKAAKDKKIDSAALAYVDMTLTCVKRHRYLRDEGTGTRAVRGRRGAGRVGRGVSGPAHGCAAGVQQDHREEPPRSPSAGGAATAVGTAPPAGRRARARRVVPLI